MSITWLVGFDHYIKEKREVMVTKKNSKTMNVLIGCDPELFVVNAEGKPRSAHGLVPGTKEEPHKVDKGAIQVDGMALEFNIDPAATEDEFVNNIATVMQKLREATPSEYKFLIKPSVKFHGSHINAQPEEAKELGCQPDFDAYTMKENPKPNANTTLRTASGHIHIGLEEGADPTTEEHMIKYSTLVKHLDLFLGLRSLEWDNDQQRRQLYGNPGAMRLKPYGVEYRVLSNMWLDREALVRFVYQQTIRCINDLRTNGALDNKMYERVASDIKNGQRYNTKYYFKDAKAKAALAAADQLKIGN
jgi:hypothetical protein